MKSWKARTEIFLCVLIVQMGLSLCLAHDNVTMHPLISDSAARSSTGLPDFLNECFGYSLGQSNLFYCDPDGAKGDKSPLEWIKAGSQYEDVPWIRGNNHFYDPTKKPAIGLTDGVNLGGQPSFVWATVETNAIWWQHSYTWLKARSFELSALTNSCKSGRETNLAAMLFYLGHVIHLNQDLTVPAHVRNDNHGVNAQNGPFAALVMWTEKFGKDTYSKETNSGFPTEQRGWSWWQNTAKFQKLEDFWNRDMLRINGANALNSDADNVSGKQVGLAEFCNGNFISENASYGDFFTKTNVAHWFRYPRLADTTEPNLRRLRWGGAEIEVDPITLPNHKSGYRTYLKKVGSGIIVTNHSALNYEAIRNPGKVGNSQMHVMLTLNDSNVLQEYHSILIPKAIEYSAGILDYFFRGTMDVTVTLDTNLHQYTFGVTNISSQDFGIGSFFLLEEDTNSVRTIVQTNALSTTMPSGTSMDITYSGPAPHGTKFLVVFQGTIGVDSNGNAPDLVDTNICIAAARPWVKQIKEYYFWEWLTNLGLTNGATITTNLESDDFGFPLTTGNYEVKINSARFDDKGTIGSIQSAGPSISCRWGNEITDTVVPNGDISITNDGRRLQVQITATDDPICNERIGWWAMTITWRAWPAQ